MPAEDMTSVSIPVNGTACFYINLFFHSTFLPVVGDIQHNGTQHNNTQHNDTQHNDIQYNNTQHNDIQHTVKQLKNRNTNHNDNQQKIPSILLC